MTILEKIILTRADEQVDAVTNGQRKVDDPHCGNVPYPPSLDRITIDWCIGCHKKKVKRKGRGYCNDCKKRLFVGLPCDNPEYPTESDCRKAKGAPLGIQWQ